MTGIAPGEVALIEGTLPGMLRLSTGVMVLYADEESFTLMTPEGHVFAGWITFSAATQDSSTVAQAQVLMRASDPIFELGMMLGGHRQEDNFWRTTLTNVAHEYGVLDPEVETATVCVDRRRQWKRWTNVFRSAAIGSMLYMLGAPFPGPDPQGPLTSRVLRAVSCGRLGSCLLPQGTTWVGRQFPVPP